MEKLNRFEYNLKIINKLKELIIKYPDLRFGQLLVNCDIIKLKTLNNKLVVEDLFNEESKITWNRILTNKFIKNL